MPVRLGPLLSRSSRALYSNLLIFIAYFEARFGDQRFWEIRSTGEGRNNEDTDINSNIGVTAHGVRPDSGAATDAGADKRHAGDRAGEREKGAYCARVEQTADKTRDGHKRKWTDECSGSRSGREQR